MWNVCMDAVLRKIQEIVTTEDRIIFALMDRLMCAVMGHFCFKRVALHLNTEALDTPTLAGRGQCFTTGSICD